MYKSAIDLSNDNTKNLVCNVQEASLSLWDNLEGYRLRDVGSTLLILKGL